MFLTSATDVCVLAIGGSEESSCYESDRSAPALPLFAIGASLPGRRLLGWTGAMVCVLLCAPRVPPCDLYVRL